MLDNDRTGEEDMTNYNTEWRGQGKPLGIKNQYCPVDGHYCEQPNCANCKREQQ